MKKLLYIMIALLIFLYPYTAKADAPSKENVTFSVLSNSSLPIAGESILGARGSDDLQEYGTTDDTGILTVSVPHGRYTLLQSLSGTTQTFNDVEVGYNTETIQLILLKLRSKSKTAPGSRFKA